MQRLSYEIEQPRADLSTWIAIKRLRAALLSLFLDSLHLTGYAMVCRLPHPSLLNLLMRWVRLLSLLLCLEEVTPE